MATHVTCVSFFDSFTLAAMINSSERKQQVRRSEELAQIASFFGLIIFVLGVSGLYYNTASSLQRLCYF